MKRAFEFAFKSDVLGDYWEFGVAQGASLARAYQNWAFFSEQRNVLPDMHFVAFDTFTGIPEFEQADGLEGYTIFEPGQFAFSQAQVRAYLASQSVDMERFDFVEGAYADSLSLPTPTRW